MPISFKAVADILAETQFVTVESVSQMDLFGYARVKLSTGHYRFCKYPMAGMIYTVLRHPPKILRHEDANKFTIKYWSGKVEEMTAKQMADLIDRVTNP